MLKDSLGKSRKVKTGDDLEASLEAQAAKRLTYLKNDLNGSDSGKKKLAADTILRELAEAQEDVAALRWYIQRQRLLDKKSVADNCEKALNKVLLCKDTEITVEELDKARGISLNEAKKVMCFTSFKHKMPNEALKEKDTKEPTLDDELKNAKTLMSRGSLPCNKTFLFLCKLK